MRKLSSIVLFIFFFTSCNLAGGSDKYSIQGTVKNHPSKSILLEKLGLQQITVVDSAIIDDKGNFKMSGVSEKGFYRLKLDNQTFFLFLLEPVQYTATIDLTNREEPMIMTGSKENDAFQRAFAELGSTQRDLQSWNMAYQSYRQQGVSQDTLDFIAQQFQITAQRLQTLMRDSSVNAPSPHIGLFYVTNEPIDRNPEQNLTVLKRLEKELPNSTYTKEFREMYNTYEEDMKKRQDLQKTAANIAVGQPAPDIELKDPNGKTFKLSALKGKVVLLDFWASWCGPCRVEMPNVVAAYNKYKDKGFTIYSVSLDKDAEAWKNSISALGMTWENNVSDLKFWQSEAAVRYGIQGIPAAFLLDRNGVIVATNLRGPSLGEKIGELIK